MDKFSSTNDNESFAAMTTNRDRRFADQAVTLTVEGLRDRGVSHYDIAKALFDMALSIAPGDGDDAEDNRNWAYLADYFEEGVKRQQEFVSEMLAALREGARENEESI